MKQASIPDIAFIKRYMQNRITATSLESIQKAQNVASNSVMMALTRCIFHSGVLICLPFNAFAIEIAEENTASAIKYNMTILLGASS